MQPSVQGGCPTQGQQQLGATAITIAHLCQKPLFSPPTFIGTHVGCLYYPTLIMPLAVRNILVYVLGEPFLMSHVTVVVRVFCTHAVNYMDAVH